MTDKIISVKGEPHYYMPHFYEHGNSVRCDGCRYFVRDEKSKSPNKNTGECHSKAHQTERGYTHRQTGWDKTEDIFRCKWWFPIDHQTGEQESLI